MKAIQLGIRDVVIMILFLVLLTIIAGRFRDWRIEQLQFRIAQTQEVLRQLQFTPQAAGALRSLGWWVQEQRGEEEK